MKIQVILLSVWSYLVGGQVGLIIRSDSQEFAVFNWLVLILSGAMVVLNGCKIVRDYQAERALLDRAMNLLETVKEDDCRDTLLTACSIAEKALSNEWLYQTGQFCRPEKDYPERGSVHDSCVEAMNTLRSAIDKCS